MIHPKAQSEAELVRSVAQRPSAENSLPGKKNKSFNFVSFLLRSLRGHFAPSERREDASHSSKLLSAAETLSVGPVIFLTASGVMYFHMYLCLRDTKTQEETEHLLLYVQHRQQRLFLWKVPIIP